MKNNFLKILCLVIPLLIFAQKTNASFSFAVYGDSRTGYDTHQEIVDQVVLKNPDFVLHTGDFVSIGSSDDEWTQFQDIAEPLLSKTPPADLQRSFFPAIGNHDLPINNYFSVFGMTDYYYSFDYENFHFISLNTEQSYIIDSEQYNWLVADLDSAQNKNIIIFLHKPAYSSGTHGSTQEIIDNLVPLFEEYGARFVFSGHDHIYERSYPIYQNTIDDENGVIYIIAGAGGAPLYPVTEGNWWTIAAESTYHFVYFEITENNFSGTTIDNNGNIIDSFEIASSDIENPTISINSGAILTNSRDVSLAVSASEDPYQMIISENSDFSEASWEIYSTTKAYALSDDDSTKTVYVKFRDEAENESAAASDNITLDTTAPVTTISPAPDSYNSVQEISLSAQDAISGLDKIYYTTDGNDPTTDSKIYSQPFKISQNTTIKYFAADLVGNSEEVQAAEYTIKKAKFVTKNAKSTEVEIIKNEINYTNDLHFNFSKVPTKKKYYAEVQRLKKYFSRLANAKQSSLKKYWQINTNLNKCAKNVVKIKLVFSYTKKELNTLKKQNKALREKNLILQYYDKNAKSLKTAKFTHNLQNNTFSFTLKKFISAKNYFVIGLK